jgi:hypothetical protein
MTVGYVSSSGANTATGAYFNIAPAGSTEIVIHNIYCGAAALIYYGSGTATCAPIYSLSSSGWVTGIFMHASSGQYVMIKNTGSASAYYLYDGIITRD